MAGGIVGVILLVAVCTCAVWITRHVQVHVHYSDKEQQGGKEDNDTRREDANYEIVAYAQTKLDKNSSTGEANRSIITDGGAVWLHNVYERRPLQDMRLHGQTAWGSQGPDVVVENAMYSRPSQIEGGAIDPVKYDHLIATPLANELATQKALEDSEDGLYEYIQ